MAADIRFSSMKATGVTGKPDSLLERGGPSRKQRIDYCISSGRGQSGSSGDRLKRGLGYVPPRRNSSGEEPEGKKFYNHTRWGGLRGH